MARATKGVVQTHQLDVREIDVKVDGTTAPASITFGGDDVTITDNGVGDYTLTLARPGRRFLNFTFSSETKVYHQRSTTTGAAVRVLTFSDAGAATDAIFTGTIRVSDSPFEF